MFRFDFFVSKQIKVGDSFSSDPYVPTATVGDSDLSCEGALVCNSIKNTGIGYNHRDRITHIEIMYTSKIEVNISSPKS